VVQSQGWLAVQGTHFLEANVMWKCPRCGRPQSFGRHIFSHGLIRKQWRCAYCNSLLRSTLIAGTIVPLIVAVVCARVAAWLLSVELSPFGYVIAPSALMLFFVWLNRRVSLVEKGHEVCWQCGYNLHKNTSGVCPECGARIVPAQVEP